MHTVESDSAVFIILQSQASRCASYRGVKLPGESNCTPQSQNWKFCCSLVAEQCEWVTQVTYKKWVTVSYSLRRSEEMSDRERIARVTHQKWANCSLFWANSSFAHFFQKMSHSLGKKMSKFPTLIRAQLKTFLFMLSL